MHCLTTVQVCDATGVAQRASAGNVKVIFRFLKNKKVVVNVFVAYICARYWLARCAIKREVRCKSGAIPVAVSF